jgi:hypothetical protein
MHDAIEWWPLAARRIPRVTLAAVALACAGAAQATDSG